MWQAPTESYADIGGLEDQIMEMKEVGFGDFVCFSSHALPQGVKSIRSAEGSWIAFDAPGALRGLSEVHGFFFLERSEARMLASNRPRECQSSSDGGASNASCYAGVSKCVSTKVILYGVPGTGKTLLAKARKKIGPTKNKILAKWLGQYPLFCIQSILYISFGYRSHLSPVRGLYMV